MITAKKSAFNLRLVIAIRAGMCRAGAKSKLRVLYGVFF